MTNSRTIFLIIISIILIMFLLNMLLNKRNTDQKYSSKIDETCDTELDLEVDSIQEHSSAEIDAYKIKESQFVDINTADTIYSDDFIDIVLSEKRLSKLILKIEAVADTLSEVCITYKFDTQETESVEIPLCIQNLQNKTVIDFPENASKLKIESVSFKKSTVKTGDIQTFKKSKHFRMLSLNTIKYNGKKTRCLFLNKWMNVTDDLELKNGNVYIVSPGVKYFIEVN